MPGRLLLQDAVNVAAAEQDLARVDSLDLAIREESRQGRDRIAIILPLQT